MPKSKSQLLTPDQLRKCIDRNYAEFAGCEMAIGLLGGTYRITIRDQFHVLHILKINIDAAQEDAALHGDL
jgi:hypothetical protein